MNTSLRSSLGGALAKLFDILNTIFKMWQNLIIVIVFYAPVYFHLNWRGYYNIVMLVSNTKD